MTQHLILASESRIRAELLRRANVEIDVVPSRVDEESIKEAMLKEKAPARDIADALADAKAFKVASNYPSSLVLGCDQVLALKDRILSKPRNAEDALSMLRDMRGDTHHLYSAAVIYEDAKPIWRHVGHVRLRMSDASDEYLEDYVNRNWTSIRHSVGAYRLEEEGVRLFSSVQGDYFTVLGIPLLELLSYLTLRGTLQG